MAISNDPLNLWILVPLGRWTLLSDRSFELPASFQSTHYYQLVIVAAQVLFTPANSTLVTVILLATLLASAPGRQLAIALWAESKVAQHRYTSQSLIGTIGSWVLVLLSAVGNSCQIDATGIEDEMSK